jgi:Tfp pilus assembly protein PilW
MRSLPTGTYLQNGEQGFTLIETLVAMLSAFVVVGALYAILIVAIDQTAQITDTVQATQTGRTTMTKLVDELHSACISSGFKPIQEGFEKSSHEESKLVFVNAYSPNAEITTAYKHEIVWQKKTGLLTEKTYTSSGGSWPTFTFPSTNTETRLGEGISESEKEGKTLPMFQYYKYSKKSTSISSEESLNTLTKMGFEETGKEALTAAEAGEASAVEITFKQVPVDKRTTENRTVDLNSLVTLSFSVPNAETPIEAKPCE